MNQGFITLHRKLLEWEWWDDHNTTRLFIYLLLKANHKDNQWQGIVIHRGELVTSHPKLSKNTGLSVQNIRTSLNRLKSTRELTVKKTNKYSIISITNYDQYQAGQQSTQQSANSQLTTNNNENNENNITNPHLPLSGESYPQAHAATDNDVFKKIDKGKKGEFDVWFLLSDYGEQQAKAKAPGWDLLYLAKIYNQGVHSGKLQRPKNVNTAFPAWCKSYTKGKSPQ